MATTGRYSVRCPERGIQGVMLLIVVVILLSSTTIEAACSSERDLINACISYAVGNKLPAPPYSSACCILLRLNGASCICSKLPANAASPAAKAAVRSVRSSCKLSYNCPGF
ncbi:hypothetical protein KP509_27G063200 [Ceratopteris richardii]|uniref:Bifunctional inhibitor/plant lipid transfer protein/seed storage helical domain-containing protein n=1 Tax=Ceratopteris richardii TaxID=49495 RepID=A0A8T2RJJ1_CERRI|nr:hypothetical protein KP509_27G063200 [Ceratopteris richardii]